MQTMLSIVFRRLALVGFVATVFLPTHLLCAQSAVADPQLDGEQQQDDFSFLRLMRNDEGEPIALEVAIARYVPNDGIPDGLYVDLIGAIHVADAKYYEDLNKRFREYDAVLYELVAPEGTRVPKGGVERESLVSMLQGGMTGVLGLAFQLDEVDYTRKNLVHADMSPEEFSKSMKDRGESMISIMMKAMSEGMARQARDPTRGNEVQLLAALFSAHREHDLKVFMAEQFADMEEMMGVFGSEDGSTLVTERNKKALAVLQREIDKGRRKLAVFYGAGHMEDMESRLKEEFGLRRAAVTWLTAWDLSAGLAKKKASQARKKKTTK